MTDSFTILRCVNCQYYTTILEASQRKFRTGRCGNCGHGFEIAFTPEPRPLHSDPLAKPATDMAIDHEKMAAHRWSALPQPLKDLVTKYSVSSRIEMHQLLDELQEIFAANELQKEFDEFVDKRARIKVLARIGARRLHDVDRHVPAFDICDQPDCQLVNGLQD